MNKSNIKRYGLLLIIFGILSILFIFPLFKWHFLPFGDDMDFNFDRIVGLKDNLMHLNLFPQICTYTFHNCAYPLYIFGSLSNRIGEELLGEALTVITQLVLPFDLREKYNQCD